MAWIAEKRVQRTQWTENQSRGESGLGKHKKQSKQRNWVVKGSKQIDPSSVSNHPLTRVGPCTLHIANIQFGNGHLLVGVSMWLEQKAQIWQGLENPKFSNVKTHIYRWYHPSNTRNNKYKYRQMDFNHTWSHFMYEYDMNIHVWVWHEWEVWLELWTQCISSLGTYLDTNCSSLEHPFTPN